MSGAGASPPQTIGQAGRTVSGGGRAINGSSALSVMMAKEREIMGRETDVASWNLKKGENWSEVRRVMKDTREDGITSKPKASNKYVLVAFSPI